MDILVAIQAVATQAKDIWDILALLALPIVLTMGPILLNRSKKAANLAKEAADSVRPNGTGHRSVVHMNEDILLRLGEISGEVKGLRSDVHNHISQPGHTVGMTKLDKVEVQVEEVHDMLNLFLKNRGA